MCAKSNFSLDEEIKKAKDILNEENPSLTKLADFIEDFSSKLQEKYPKMMEIAMSAGAAAPAQSSSNSDDSQSAEPTLFNIFIVEAAKDKKLALIKEVRAITGMSLSESKSLADKVIAGEEVQLKSSVDPNTAKEIKAKLEPIAKTKLVGADE